MADSAHDTWKVLLVCPLDHAPLKHDVSGEWICTGCGHHFPMADVKGRQVADLRALDVPGTATVQFTVPHLPLDRTVMAERMFRAPQADFPHYSKREIRRRFGTKLDKGMQYYSQQVLKERGPDAPVLDLGCGNGGNRRYLEELGFRQVVTVDWIASGADVLADAHRLPFNHGVFDLVISTAVFEHLWNPYLAMAEVARVLGPAGTFLGGASFWEAWHGSSYFHLTPDGWNALLLQNGMTLLDLWPGWGIVPAALSHVIAPGYLRGPGYAMQRVLEGAYRLTGGEASVRRFQLRASGAYIVHAMKADS